MLLKTNITMDTGNQEMKKCRGWPQDACSLDRRRLFLPPDTFDRQENKYVRFFIFAGMKACMRLSNEKAIF